MMAAAKDATELAKFMTLFQKLRDWIDDEPSGLDALAEKDGSIKQLCVDLDLAASYLSMNERRRRRLFAAPVDPKFIEAWRAYEERYATQIARVWLSDLGLGAASSPANDGSAGDTKWMLADDDAEVQARAIEKAMDFAEFNIDQEHRDFPNDFRADIENGIAAWSSLKEATGFDLRGVFRRRELVPFVLIPRHVAHKHGDAEKLSLFTHLQQAHDAFVLGVPFAALALMRSVLEVTLERHYGAEGQDLKERIENCRSLPKGASKAALHRLRRLANAVLHVDEERHRLPRDMEKELLSLLVVLRSLIEGAPVR